MAKTLKKGQGRGKKPELSSEDLKAHIIKTARKHFAIHGFQGTNLRDVAKDAGIANSLINYHFKDKTGLLAATIESFARDRMATIQRILTEPKGRDEMRVRIELFVEEMLSSVVADPYGFDIIDREVRSGNPVVIKIFEKTMLVAFKSVVAFFTQARDRGLLREEVNPIVVSGLLMGSCCDSARKEILAKKFFNVSFEDPEWRNTVARNIVCLFMRGVVR